MERWSDEGGDGSGWRRQLAALLAWRDDPAGGAGQHCNVPFRVRRYAPTSSAAPVDLGGWLALVRHRAAAAGAADGRTLPLPAELRAELDTLAAAGQLDWGAAPPAADWAAWREWDATFLRLLAVRDALLARMGLDALAELARFLEPAALPRTLSAAGLPPDDNLAAWVAEQQAASHRRNGLTTEQRAKLECLVEARHLSWGAPPPPEATAAPAPANSAAEAPPPKRRRLKSKDAAKKGAEADGRQAPRGAAQLPQPEWQQEAQQVGEEDGGAAGAETVEDAGAAVGFPARLGSGDTAIGEQRWEPLEPAGMDERAPPVSPRSPAADGPAAPPHTARPDAPAVALASSEAAPPATTSRERSGADNRGSRHSSATDSGSHPGAGTGRDTQRGGIANTGQQGGGPTDRGCQRGGVIGNGRPRRGRGGQRSDTAAIT
eukprot:jgi/Tetstr1/446033/TSEL_033635.t1